MGAGTVPHLNITPHPSCDPACSCGCHKDDEATYRPVAGFCPACGSASLGIRVWPKDSDPSRVYCMSPQCPQPDAVKDLLSVARTEHTVQLTADGYTIKHPTLERIGDALFACSATAWMSQLIRETEPEPGWYRMDYEAGAWTLTPLDGAGS